MKSGQGRQDDIPFLLFLVPFAVSGLYAIFLWVTTGLSAVLPSSVFLEVTESPYVFIVGFVAVMAGVSIDILSQEPARRRSALFHESDTLQKIAVAALVLGALCAWYAAGFDLGGAASNFIQGRYVIIFPVLLIVFSFLLLPSVTVKKSQVRNLAIIVLLLAVPVSVDEVGKRNFYVGIAVGLVFLAFALYLYLSDPRTGGAKTSSV